MPGDARERFAQQSIEVAVFADAVATAFDLTGDADWLEVINRGCARLRVVRW